MKRILVTGFGKFGQVKVNPSEILVKKLAKLYPEIDTYVFRVNYKEIDEQLPKLLGQFKPEVVVMFGYAGRSSDVRLERTAVLEGKNYESTLPLEKIYTGLIGKKISATYSNDAGNYACNYLFAKVGELTKKYKIKEYGFIHLPNEDKYELKSGLKLDLIGVGKAVIDCLL